VLQLNDDGTVTFPLAATNGAAPEIVTLREPTMGELSALYRRIREVDSSLPPVAVPNSEEASVRNMAVFAPEDGSLPPYGAAFAEMVAMLSGRALAAEELPAWAMSPRAIAQCVAHLPNPLPGVV